METERASTKVLRENLPIKQSAVRYAKWFMVLVPLSCLVLLLFWSEGGLSIEVSRDPVLIAVSTKPGAASYTQAVLIVAPIAFVVTLLGFLIRGMFAGSGDKEEPSLSDLTSAARLLSQTTRSGS